MTDELEFDNRNRMKISEIAADKAFREVSATWFERASRYEYSYHFKWLGRPIIQFPQDMVALQEVIWDTKPDLIIETGIARGGSLVFMASMLELLGGDGLVVGIDIDIRSHNRRALEEHFLFHRMHLIEGSSTDPDVTDQVESIARDRDRVMVVLDSNHTANHVAAELDAYAGLVTKGSYLVVMDTVIEEMPPTFSTGRPWSPGNSPMTAVDSFLSGNDRFEIDEMIPAKLQLTVAPRGYLRCIEN